MKSELKKIRVGVLLLLVAITAVWGYGNFYNIMNLVKSSELPSDSFSLKDFSRTTEGRLLSQSGDAWVEISDVNRYIKTLDVRVVAIDPQPDTLQVFYTTSSQRDYAETHSYTVALNNSNNYHIELAGHSKIHSIRVDLGSKQGEQFVFDGVRVNSNLKWNLMMKELTLLVLVFVLIWIIMRYIDYVIKWRYLIISVLFVVLVLLKLNGSSIGVWDKLITTYSDGQTHSSVLLGKSREIRSDEYIVNTPYMLSQVDNGFPLINPDIRSTGQNMLIPNMPVLSLDSIGKPQFWGFYLLGKDYGLSW